MFTLTVNLERAESVREALREISAADVLGAVNTVVAEKAADLTRAHLYGLANTRHRPNVRLNFYKDAADSIKQEVLADGALIRGDKAGLAQRFHGGHIEAINFSHLWIPVTPESEGKAPGEFMRGDTRLVKIVSPTTNKGVGILHTKGGKLSEEPVLFALVHDLDQDPDPTVLPTDQEYADAALAGISDYFDSLLVASGDTQ